jgi:hypothetical protein
MKRIVVNTNLFFILISLFSFVQGTQEVKNVSWGDLSAVSYRRTFSPSDQVFYDKPIFAKEIAMLQNERIKITGYVIPVDTYGEKYFLSAKPNASCFFCGKGQIHEVMELKLKNLPANYKMDEYLTFEGVFHTHTEVGSIPYSLDVATLVK